MTHAYRGQDDDARLLARVGLTLEDAELDAQRVEDETQDDDLMGVYYPGFHLDQDTRSELMTAISVRIPQSTLNTINRRAKQFNLTRSEYIRRKLLA